MRVIRKEDDPAPSRTVAGTLGRARVAICLTLKLKSIIKTGVAFNQTNKIHYPICCQ